MSLRLLIKAETWASSSREIPTTHSSFVWGLVLLAIELALWFPWMKENKKWEDPSLRWATFLTPGLLLSSPFLPFPCLGFWVRGARLVFPGLCLSLFTTFPFLLKNRRTRLERLKEKTKKTPNNTVYNSWDPRIPTFFWGRRHLRVVSGEKHPAAVMRASLSRWSGCGRSGWSRSYTYLKKKQTKPVFTVLTF